MQGIVIVLKDVFKHNRYSAEFTVYRELIQNANDAGATEVHVEFKTRPENISSQDKQVISSIVVRNNGRAFSEDDWRRLKKIAEGNPDEQKVFVKQLQLI